MVVMLIMVILTLPWIIQFSLLISYFIIISWKNWILWTNMHYKPLICWWGAPGWESPPAKIRNIFIYPVITLFNNILIFDTQIPKCKCNCKCIQTSKCLSVMSVTLLTLQEQTSFLSSGSIRIRRIESLRIEILEIWMGVIELARILRKAHFYSCIQWNQSYPLWGFEDGEESLPFLVHEPVPFDYV